MREEGSKRSRVFWVSVERRNLPDSDDSDPYREAMLRQKNRVKDNDFTNNPFVDRN